MTKRNFKSVKSGQMKPHSKTGEMIPKRKKVSANSPQKFLSMVGMVIDVHSDDRFIPNPNKPLGAWLKYVTKHQNMLKDPREPYGKHCGRCGAIKRYSRSEHNNRLSLKCPHSAGRTVHPENTGTGRHFCQIKNERIYSVIESEIIKK